MINEYLIKEDILLSEYVSKFNLSRHHLFSLIGNNNILINNKIIKNDIKLNKNDKLKIISNNFNYKPIYFNLDIVYEDDNILIINKPSNVIIYDTDDNIESLANYVKYYYDLTGYNIDVLFAHRLDKETSGLILLCKDILSLSYFSNLFLNHNIKREYHLLINGKLKNKIGKIDLPIGSDRHNNNKYLVTKNGKRSITNYKVLKEYNNYSLISCILETGRTHQIRVHLSHLGNPLLGDKLYGDKSNLINRCALHSYKMNFYHPFLNKELEIIKEESIDMLKLIKE